MANETSVNGAVSAPMLGNVAHSRPDVEIRPLSVNVICQNLGGYQPAQCVTLDLYYGPLHTRLVC